MGRGSSPLARGRHRRRHRPPPEPGIIPARAGSTGSSSQAGGIQPGSSPLARGRPSGVVGVPGCRGIIPARAGSTRCTPTSRHSCRDHPRSRGVDGQCRVQLRFREGSSPLARGRHLGPLGDAPCRGIIPARAGSTSRAAREARQSGDHPRSRGVDQGEALGITLDNRIIPARAGSTHRVPASFVSGRDHPRSRGVDVPFVRLKVPVPGSSPLARGRPAPCAPKRGCGRIIPARAGSTSSGIPSPGSARDHPRSRGVDPPARCAGAARRDHPRSRGVDPMYPHEPPLVPGSSPLARGRRGGRRRACAVFRIIPARAGSTLSGSGGVQCA